MKCKNYQQEINSTKLCYTCVYVSHLVIFIVRGRDHMVVGFTTTYAISAYHH